MIQNTKQLFSYLIYKKRYYCISFAFIVLCTSITDLRAQVYAAFDCTNTLLSNGGFENSTTDWTSVFSGAASGSGIVSDAASGSSAIQISGGSGQFYQCVPATAGQRYTLKAMAKRSDSGGGNHYIILEFKGAGGIVLGAQSTWVGANSYEPYYIVLDAPANTIEVCAKAVKDNGTGTMTVDDFCILQCPTFNPGEIQSNQSYCAPSDPSPILSVSPANGCSNITYQWQIKTDVSSGYWKTIAGATSPSWDPPFTSSTYWTRRLAICDGCSEVSNVGDIFITNNGPQVTTTSSNTSCDENNGSITFTFTDNSNQSGIAFSIDGGNNYSYSTNDNAGSYTISGLASGTYDTWARWNNGNCPTDLPDETINEVNCGDCTIAATISNQIYNDNNTPSNLGDDTFTFDLTVNGNGTAGWFGGGQYGSYGQTVSSGPYPVDSDGILFTVSDVNDTGCKVSIGANMSSCIYLETCTCCKID